MEGVDEGKRVLEGDEKEGDAEMGVILEASDGVKAR